MTRAVLVFVLVVVASCFAQSSPEKTGNGYENHNQVDYGPLKLSTRITGTVQDFQKVAIPEARILVFTGDQHKLVRATVSNDRGRFTLKLAPGRYRIIVKYDGFCSANIPVLIESGRTAKLLVAHMRPQSLDECSYGDYK